MLLTDVKDFLAARGQASLSDLAMHFTMRIDQTYLRPHRTAHRTINMNFAIANNIAFKRCIAGNVRRL